MAGLVPAIRVFYAASREDVDAGLKARHDDVESNHNKKPGRDSVIYVVATLTIKPETRAELIAAAKTVIGITRKEKGCILYDLHESMTDPARFVFVEQWETMEDLMAHGGNEHMKPWRKVVKECMSAPTKIEIITPEKVDVR
jgi:quinol monooxygenase YgiN